MLLEREHKLDEADQRVNFILFELDPEFARSLQIPAPDGYSYDDTKGLIDGHPHGEICSPAEASSSIPA
jgi:hypothetical protein